MPTLDFVADILCPWCFIARRQLDAVLPELAREGLRIDWVWRPFLLDPDAAGADAGTHFERRFGSLPRAERYHASVAEAGRAAGIDFRYDRITRIPNALDAHRLLLAAPNPGVQHALAEALATAFFTAGADLGDHAVLTALAAAAGFDPASAGAALASTDFADDVRRSDRAAKRAGIRAVPAFCLHGRILQITELDALADGLRTADRALSTTPA